MLSIAWFFESVWGRRCLLLLVICIAAFAIREHYIHQGEKKQVVVEQQSTLKDTTAQTNDDRAVLLEGLKAATTALNSASASIAASQAQQQVLVGQLAQLSGQRVAADNTLKKLPDSALHGFVTTKLALRPPTDDTPGYQPVEERAIAQCVTDEPLCEAGKALLQKQNDQKDVELKAQDEKDAAVRESYSLLADFSTKLEGHYVTLYNAFAAKTRGSQCLYLWHCKRQTISAPKPSDLVLPVLAVRP